MKYTKMDNCIDQLIKQYGNDLLEVIESNEEEVMEVVMESLIETIKENYKPKDINIIEDLAKLLNGNNYGDELENPYNIDVEEICRKNKWVVLFPYSDDNLEARGYIDDEIGAWDGVNAILYKKGDFYPEDEDEETFKRAPENMIIGIDKETIYESEIENNKIGIKLLWCSGDHEQYTWYIETNYKKVAYFDINDWDDDKDQIWARCCIIDCSDYYKN